FAIYPPLSLCLPLHAPLFISPPLSLLLFFYYSLWSYQYLPLSSRYPHSVRQNVPGVRYFLCMYYTSLCVSSLHLPLPLSRSTSLLRIPRCFFLRPSHFFLFFIPLSLWSCQYLPLSSRCQHSVRQNVPGVRYFLCVY
ncbi:unnamed protein product, partial [Laminaria digitata]